MDYEEEATQPCTQPMPMTGRRAINTTGILCTLFPTTATARNTVNKLLQINPNFVFIPQSSVDSSDLDEGLGLPGTSVNGVPSIALRFEPGPKDPPKGFLLGRNSFKCDVTIGDIQTTRRVSNVHFRIYVTEQHILMLEDCSTNGTFVDNVYLGPRENNNHDLKLPEHLRPRARQLGNGSEIFLLKGPKEEETRFLVRIPKSDGSGFLSDRVMYSEYDPERNSMEQPVAGPSAYLIHMQNMLGQVGAVVSFPQAQRTNWPGQKTYELMDMIGHGAFATVHRAVKDDGTPVAVKIIQRKASLMNKVDQGKGRAGVRKEVEILEALKHVSYHQS